MKPAMAKLTALPGPIFQPDTLASFVNGTYCSIMKNRVKAEMGKYIKSLEGLEKESLLTTEQAIVLCPALQKG
ncbi:MAG: hypothetical protein WAV13_01700 [Thermodesulfovibrionales bacterium]